jgi:hypothetical protein
MSRPAYNLVLRTEPPVEGEPPAEIRLRQVLKVSLRGFRFRCVSITEHVADGDAAGGAEAGQATAEKMGAACGNPSYRSEPAGSVVVSAFGEA